MQKVRQKKAKVIDTRYHSKKRAEYAKRKEDRAFKRKYNSISMTEKERKIATKYIETNLKSMMSKRNEKGFEKLYKTYSTKPQQFKVEMLQTLKFKMEESNTSMENVVKVVMPNSHYNRSPQSIWATNILNTFYKFRPEEYNQLAVELGADPMNCGITLRESDNGKGYLRIKGKNGTFMLVPKYRSISPKGDESVDDAFTVVQVG